MIRNRFNAISMCSETVRELLKQSGVMCVGATKDGGVFVHLVSYHSVVFYSWEPQDLVMARYRAVADATLYDYTGSTLSDSSVLGDSDGFLLMTTPGPTTGSNQAYRFTTLKARDD
jgi:hypothetical protein